MNNVIDISKAIDVEYEDVIPGETESIAPEASAEDPNFDAIAAARKEKISQLPRYRGEIPTKSMLRKLPDLKTGEIFWVTNDNAPFIVSEKEKGKVGLKALDENTSVSTGYTIYEMNKALVSKEPVFNFQDAEANEKLMLDLKKYFKEDTSDEFYLMFNADQKYFSIFKCENHENPDVGSLIETIGNIGHLISVDRDVALGEQEALEIWIRTEKDKAGLFYLFPFDGALVKM